MKFGVAAKVTDLLDEAGIAYSVYSDIKPNPTIQNVTDGVEAFKAAEADSIVTIGGGSAMDTAKAIGVIITNPEFADVRSLEGVACAMLLPIAMEFNKPVVTERLAKVAEAMGVDTTGMSTDEAADASSSPST